MKEANIENNKENNENIDNSDEEIFYEEDLEKIINANNEINEEDLQRINLESPNPNFPSQYQEFQPEERDENDKKKILLNESIPVEYEQIPYQLFIYLKEEKENKLAIE